jgi:hypothetical protein
MSKMCSQTPSVSLEILVQAFKVKQVRVTVTVRIDRVAPEMPKILRGEEHTYMSSC